MNSGFLGLIHIPVELKKRFDLYSNFLVLKPDRLLLFQSLPAAGGDEK
jgi:hypothetical protein